MSDSNSQAGSRLLDHFLNPRNAGDLPDADGAAEVGATACGDVMRFAIKVRDGRITDARFRTFGGSAAIATTSALTELVIDRTVDEAGKITGQDIVNALGGLPPAKLHCSVLAEEALRAALENFIRRQSKPANQS